MLSDSDKHVFALSSAALFLKAWYVKVLQMVHVSFRMRLTRMHTISADISQYLF